MRKFRLKLDIPGHTAGEIFTITEAGGLLDAGEYLVFTGEEISRHPDIMDWFEEAENRWRPELGEDYWFVDSYGDVGERVWKSERYDFGRNTMGDVFRTKEEAEAHCKWLMAVAVLRADTADQHPDWAPEETNWFVAYNHSCKELIVLSCGDIQRLTFAFDNRDDAERSIAEHKAEWLTFLGVE